MKTFDENIMKCNWKNTDPRKSINKRADIIILKPNNEVEHAHVDTKETYCIRTMNGYIGEKDSWDLSWWTWGPYLGKYTWDPWTNSDPRFDVSNGNKIIICHSNFASPIIGKIDNENHWSINYFTGNLWSVLFDADTHYWPENYFWIYYPEGIYEK